ncbi:hydroxypyruvate isomerase family protein [Microbacterium ulmi]|uniref:TIM barrel protein n=1 Tax=Microbacterium ulmi TaxID=179095 RepID=A0A7Y2M1Q8_9MICO|nr:TIM barrel protein [Microbacterium ulmi]NII68276.1 hydroxypyruvate isomerase [Microbacterium ulmi]NNH04880.1 TIM barrel protein [Microbacterium ulmi]
MVATSAAVALDANLGWLFTELPFEERFEAAAVAGFRAVEYPSPYEHDASLLRRLLAESGLHQVLINTPTGEPGTETGAGLACLRDRVGEFRDGLEKGLEYADALDSDFLHIVGGAVPSGTSRDEALAQYAANVAWSAEKARATRVRLVLEMQNKTDVPGFILDAPQDAVAVIEQIGADNVGVLLDVYHVRMQGGDVLRTAAAVRPHISHVQIADPPRRTEPGSGEIDWAAIFGFFVDSDYRGWIGCEYRPAAGTIPGLAWIDELARKGVPVAGALDPE